MTFPKRGRGRESPGERFRGRGLLNGGENQNRAAIGQQRDERAENNDDATEPDAFHQRI